MENGRSMNGPIGDQALAETLEEPLNTSQVVSGVGDILARLSTDNEHVKDVSDVTASC